MDHGKGAGTRAKERPSRRDRAARWTRVRDQFLCSVAGVDSHRRLAAGLTMGLLLGLAPKFTLGAWVLFALILFSTANLLTGMIGCGAGCLMIVGFGSTIDRWFDGIGMAVAGQRFLQGWIEIACRTPILAWAQWDNSVVLGNALFGLLASIPLYLLFCGIFRWLRPSMLSWLDGSSSTRWMLGNDPVRSSQSPSNPSTIS